MNWNLSISYSWWFVLLCLVVGAVYATLLYLPAKNLGPISEHKWFRKLLPFLRFSLVSLLAFLLLGPVLKYAGFQTQKPIVTVLLDDSKSMATIGKDAFAYNQAVTDLKQGLEQKCKVNTVLYSNVPQFAKISDWHLSGNETNMSQAIRFVAEQHVNQNLGATVLFSDGIYNAGSNPSFITENYTVPIYTIGVGDTTVYADLAVQNVSHNSLAYLGNDFPFRVEIKANKLIGKQANMQVLLNGKTIKQKSISISKESYFEEIDMVAKAGRVGQSKVDVRLTTFDNEKNTSNNSYTFYVDVIDGKKKVAIWADAAHPDLGMLKTVINSNENYEAKISLQSYEVDSDLDLVILHDWFASKSQLTVYEKLRSSGIPTLIVTGNRFNSSVFNAGSQAIKYNSKGKSSNATLPLVNGNFEYFELEPETKSSIKKWPPLNSPYGKFSGYQPSDVLLYQQIGSVATQEPMVLLSSASKTRIGILAGTGIWQWRLSEYEQNGSHNILVSIVSKIVQYLAVKEDKKLLKVYPSAKKYGVGESVTLLGELYNQSLDPIRGQEINIALKDATGKVYKHTMTASGSQYRLVLSSLAKGAYQYTAKATIGGVGLKDNGYFTIMGQQKELINLTADFNTLRNLSNSTGGSFYTLGNINNLKEVLLNNENLKSIITEENKLEDLINFKWVFWLLIALLSVEWFVRKWAGGY